MKTPTNWSVLRSPRWLAATIVAVGFAILFVSLGLWQLDRLDERRERNATIEGRTAEPVRPLAGLRGEYGDDPDALAFRRTAAGGRYLADAEFFSIGRVYGDVSGTLVATPMVLEDGSVLIVLRGLVPSGTEGPPALGYEVPEGAVAVTGRLEKGEAPSRITENEPENGVLTSVSRLDLDFIGQWIEGDVLPFTLLVDEQRPAGPGDTPIQIPSEELTEGSHLGYAIQWFAFAIIAIVGLVALLYRAATSAGEDEPVTTPAQ